MRRLERDQRQPPNNIGGDRKKERTKRDFGRTTAATVVMVESVAAAAAAAAAATLRETQNHYNCFFPSPFFISSYSFYDTRVFAFFIFSLYFYACKAAHTHTITRKQQ